MKLVDTEATVSMGYRSQVTLDVRLYYALMYIECDTFDLPQNGLILIHLESGKTMDLQGHLLGDFNKI